jgi:hypothetical protein
VCAGRLLAGRLSLSRDSTYRQGTPEGSTLFDSTGSAVGDILGMIDVVDVELDDGVVENNQVRLESRRMICVELVRIENKLKPSDPVTPIPEFVKQDKFPSESILLAVLDLVLSSERSIQVPKHFFLPFIQQMFENHRTPQWNPIIMVLNHSVFVPILRNLSRTITAICATPQFMLTIVVWLVLRHIDLSQLLAE